MMKTTLLITMLIWGGNFQGGPATIPGWHSKAACERAVASTVSRFQELANLSTIFGPGVRAACIEHENPREDQRE